MRKCGIRLVDATRFCRRLVDEFSIDSQVGRGTTVIAHPDGVLGPYLDSLAHIREQLDAWSHDGKWLYYSSTARDIGASNDVYRVSPAGGTPMQVSADRYANEWAAAPAPDGSSSARESRSTSCMASRILRPSSRTVPLPNSVSSVGIFFICSRVPVTS